MKSSYKKLGQYIKQVSNKNTSLGADSLKGININKEFMPSVANVTGTDLLKYKIVGYNQFAYNPMHVGRDEILPIGMHDTHENIIVSPAYTVFEVIKPDELLPEYLMMWFRRPEFDRNAWFTTDSSVRGGFSWDDLCEMKLPVPTPEKQRQIVDEYNTIVNRIKLNEELCKKLEETAQAIYKHWFVDFEFPISAEYAKSIGKPELEGKPYKSSGGEMVYNEELDQEIPLGWASGTIADIYDFQYGKGNINPDNGGMYPVYGSNGVIGWYDEYNSEECPVIGHIGVNCGSLIFAFGKHFVTYNGVICKAKEDFSAYVGYCILKSKDLMSQTRGSSQPFISYDMLYEIKAVLPVKIVMNDASTFLKEIFSRLRDNKTESMVLNTLKWLVLAQLSKVV